MSLNPAKNRRLSFLKIAKAGGRIWDHLVFVYFLLLMTLDHSATTPPIEDGAKEPLLHTSARRGTKLATPLINAEI